MKMAELKMLPVSVLKPAEYNPRKKRTHNLRKMYFFCNKSEHFC